MCVGKPPKAPPPILPPPPPDEGATELEEPEQKRKRGTVSGLESLRVPLAPVNIASAVANRLNL